MKKLQVERQRYYIDKTLKEGQFRIRILVHRLICVLNQLKNYSNSFWADLVHKLICDIGDCVCKNGLISEGIFTSA